MTDQIIAIEVEAVAWDRRAWTAIDQRRIDVPDGVDASELREFLEARFGPSTGTVHTQDDAMGDIVVGWLFDPAGLATLGLEHEGAALLAVPFVRFADGQRRELTIYNAELAARFDELARSLEPDLVPGGSLLAPRGQDDPDELLRLGGVHEDSGRRLEHEQLELYHSDREGMALEIFGWLRRMLAEGHTFLVIEVGHQGRYLQFVTHDGTWLRGEVVGPANLVGCRPLGDTEMLTLLALDWFEPDEGSGAGNFWREWGDPETGERVDVEEAAHLAAQTLDAAFGPIDPRRVDITTGSSRPDEPH